MGRTLRAVALLLLVGSLCACSKQADVHEDIPQETTYRPFLVIKVLDGKDDVVNKTLDNVIDIKSLAGYRTKYKYLQGLENYILMAPMFLATPLDDTYYIFGSLPEGTSEDNTISLEDLLSDGVQLGQEDGKLKYNSMKPTLDGETIGVLNIVTEESGQLIGVVFVPEEGEVPEEHAESLLTITVTLGAEEQTYMLDSAEQLIYLPGTYITGENADKLLQFCSDSEIPVTMSGEYDSALVYRIDVNRDENNIPTGVVLDETKQ